VALHLKVVNRKFTYLTENFMIASASTAAVSTKPQTSPANNQDVIGGSAPLSKLLDYLNKLDQDANALESHKQDPVQAMNAFGLTAEEKKAMHYGDKNLAAKLIGADPDELPVFEIPQF
jgi:hypothetical protein